MKATHVRDEALVWDDAPDPEPAVDEALLRVRAAGVNRADLVQRSGRYPPPPGAPETLGLEVAGEVFTAPEGCGWKPGDRACALLSGGGYAELAAVPVRMLIPVPDTIDLAAAASLPEVHLTAFLNLFTEAGLQPGERVLIHGGASGVGTAAIQQARLAGARVATTSSDAKRERCRALGAEQALDRRDPAWPARLRDAWGGVDVILDMVGADTAAAALDLLAVGGRLVWIAALSGSAVTIDVRTMMRKRIALKGSTLRPRPIGEKIALRDAFVARFAAEIERGRIVPVLHAVLPITEAERAHALLRANATVGKVVLEMP